MAKLLDTIKRLLGGKRERGDRRRRRRRADSYYESSLGKEIEQAPPDRAGELAGHPPERVDT